MSQDNEAFLSRWSRLKNEQAAKAEAPAEAALPEAHQDAPPELPPVDQLTAESDFSGFMHPKVADGLRRTALKKLFSDPQFNVPDPYEAYSGDYTVGDPISEELMKQLYQGQQLLFSDQKKEEKEEKDEKDEAAQQAVEPSSAEEKRQDGAGRQDA